MHPPTQPLTFRPFVGAGIHGGLVRRLRRRFLTAPTSVGNGISRDGVEPGGGCPPLGTKRRGRTPYGHERLLQGVFGPSGVAEPSLRERQDGSSVAPVEDLEGVVISVGDPLEQALVLERRAGHDYESLSRLAWRS